MNFGDWIVLIDNILTSTVRLSTPITLAALGAVICEKSGIVNIAMEGLMLMGAFFAAWIALVTGNPWMGVLAGIIGGGIFSLLHAWATITLHLNHVISGAVINILAYGLTRYFMVLIFGHPGTTPMITNNLSNYRFAVPILSEIPLIGNALFNQTPIIYMTFILVLAIIFLMNKTRLGLHIKASGEHPMALETMGVSVKKIRYISVLASGLLCGLGGAFLSIEDVASFNEGMTSGRGFIALAANVSGGWSPVGAFIASLFFGFVNALQTRFQTWKILPIDAEYFLMFPYIATVIAVAGLVRKSRAPKASGEDFTIE